MAEYSTPQGWNPTIPDDNSLFISGTGDGPITNGNIGYRSGNTIYQKSIVDIGNEYLQSQGKVPLGGFVYSGGAWTNNGGYTSNDAKNAGLEYLKQQGIDVTGLRVLSGAESADLSALITRGGTGLTSGTFDLSGLLNTFKANNAGGGSLTQTINPTNPYNTVVTDTSGKTVFQGTSLQENLANAGATPTQIASLGAAADINAGLGSAGQAAPYSGTQLSSAGVSTAPITPQSIQQGASSITTTGLTIPTVPLQPGSADTAAVKALQDYLVKAGYMTQAEVNTGYGIYGPKTTAAVTKLQQDLGVDNSTGVGYFGPRTIAALQASNTTSPNTTPGPVTATGLASGAGTPIDLGGGMVAGATAYNPAAVAAGAEATSKGIQDYINMLNGPTTATESRYNKLLGEVEGLLPSLQGRGQAQIDAEKAAGVDILKQRLAAVNSEMLRRTAEYKALTIDQEGKPVTMNSIIGAQAQIQKVMAADIGMLQATALGLQGQLEAAQETANRAVDLKYSDAQDAIDLRMKQLELISGELTKEEQVRANAISLYLTDQKERLEAAKATEKELTSFNIEAMQKYPSAGISVGDSYATTQSKIVNSAEYKAAQLKATSSGSGTGISNQQIDNERSLMTQFTSQPIVKDYNEILAQKGTIDSYIQNGTGGPADLALVFSFMKGLDPSSVVRESEYESAAKSGNIFAGAFTKFNGYFKENGGFLPDNVKAEFQNLVNQKLAVKQAQYDNLKLQYEALAERQGLDPRNVVIDYASGGYTPPEGGMSTGAPAGSTTAEEPKSFWSGITNWLWGA